MDINKRRLGALKTAAAAQGVQGLIRTQASDLCQYAEWVAQQPEADRQQHCYDRVLLDAPCSGLGVLAKRCVPCLLQMMSAVTQFAMVDQNLQWKDLQVDLPVCYRGAQ